MTGNTNDDNPDNDGESNDNNDDENDDNHLVEEPEILGPAARLNPRTSNLDPLILRTRIRPALKLASR